MDRHHLKSKHSNPNNFVSWKEWKKEKMAKKKELKEMKLTKKLKKMEKNILNNSQKCDEKKEPKDNEKGQRYTVSIALPGSILDNAQSKELRTYLAGQIARAACIFNVNEIVIFDEYGLMKNTEDIDEETLKLSKKHHGCIQMARLLQFLDCPQYLRKYFFPIHSDLEYSALLNPLDAPHHLRVNEESKYREGVVMNKPIKDGRGSYVYIGLQKTAIIDKPLTPNIRVTVELDSEQPSKKHFKGKVVSPLKPYKCDGIYWGYTVRIAKTFSAVFEECSYKDRYDAVIGTSDKGKDVDDFSMPPFKHLLIVFGGLQGIETCLETDETFKINDPNELFQYYLNTCPLQGSRTIRTEEAILITLSILRPKILIAQQAVQMDLNSS